VQRFVIKYRIENYQRPLFLFRKELKAATDGFVKELCARVPEIRDTFIMCDATNNPPVLEANGFWLLDLYLSLRSDPVKQHKYPMGWSEETNGWPSIWYRYDHWTGPEVKGIDLGSICVQEHFVATSKYTGAVISDTWKGKTSVTKDGIEYAFPTFDEARDFLHRFVRGTPYLVSVRVPPGDYHGMILSVTPGKDGKAWGEVQVSMVSNRGYLPLEIEV
jgi:hypothetical protein